MNGKEKEIFSKNGFRVKPGMIAISKQYPTLS